MTDEQAFAWLRSMVGPNVTAITLVRGPAVGDPEPTDVTVILTGGTPEDSERVRTRLGLRFPMLRTKVRP